MQAPPYGKRGSSRRAIAFFAEKVQIAVDVLLFRRGTFSLLPDLLKDAVARVSTKKLPMMSLLFTDALANCPTQKEQEYK